MESWPELLRLILLIFGIINFISFLSVLWCFLSIEDNWFCYIYLSYCLLACSYMPVLTTQFSMHAFLFRFIDTRMHVPARHLAFATPLIRTLDLHVQISELKTCGFSWLLIRDAQRKHRSSADHSEALSFPAPTRLSSFPFVTRERLLYCSYLYIPLYSRIYAYQWCNILVILCHILWEFYNCTQIFECIMHNILL